MTEESKKEEKKISQDLKDLVIERYAGATKAKGITRIT